MLALLAALCVFLPDDTFLSQIFDLLPFTDHYDYRAWLAVGILLNAILTFAVEKLVLGTVTEWADKRRKAKKKDAFASTIDGY